MCLIQDIEFKMIFIIDVKRLVMTKRTLLLLLKDLLNCNLEFKKIDYKVKPNVQECGNFFKKKCLK